MTRDLSVLPVDDEALRLVNASQREVPSILRSYVFPADTSNGTPSIRLIHVDRDALPLGEIVVYRFAADPKEGVHYPSQVALSSPEDERVAPTPAGWGSWETAKIVERRRRR